MRENPPTVPQFDKLQRNILATSPRVTRFKIDWDDNAGVQDLPSTSNGQSHDAQVEDSNGPLNQIFQESTNHSMEMEVM
ncbi:histone chaperone asf1-like [Uloborus diversus]|nr:histone chaperone asf1-like [Uloborus diversus]